MSERFTRTITFLVILVFFAETCGYGLATLPASNNPTSKRTILAELHRSHDVRYADSEEALRLLEENKAESLLLSSGEYLVRPKTAWDDLELISAIYYSDVMAMLNILERDKPYLYDIVRKAVIDGYPDSGEARFLEHQDVNHVISRVLRWFLLVNDGVISSADIPEEERIFLVGIAPIIVSLESIFREEGFWDSSHKKGSRSYRIRKARLSGMRFYRTGYREGIIDPLREGVRREVSRISVPGQAINKEWTVDIIYAAVTDPSVYPEQTSWRDKLVKARDLVWRAAGKLKIPGQEKSFEELLLETVRVELQPLSTGSSLERIRNVLFSVMEQNLDPKDIRRLMDVVSGMSKARKGRYSDLEFTRKYRADLLEKLDRINRVLDSIPDGEGITGEELKKKVPKWIDECLQLLYKKTDPGFFKKFYTGKKIREPGHAFEHALNNLEWSYMIMASAGDPVEVARNQRMTENDHKVLVYATLLHDISNVFETNIHAIVSSYLIGCLLDGEDVLSPEDVVKVIVTASAHHAGEVVKAFGDEIYKEYHPSNILKDADTLDNGMTIEVTAGLASRGVKNDPGYAKEKWFNREITKHQRLDHLNKKPGRSFKDMGLEHDGFQHLLDYGFNHRIPGYYKTDGARSILLSGRDILEEVKGPALIIPRFFRTDGKGRRARDVEALSATGEPVITGIPEIVLRFFDQINEKLRDRGEEAFSGEEKELFREACFFIYERRVLKRVFEDADIDYAAYFNEENYPELEKRVNSAREMVRTAVKKSGGDYSKFKAFLIGATIIQEIDRHVKGVEGEFNVFIGGIGENLGANDPAEVEYDFIRRVLKTLIDKKATIYLSDRMASTPLFVLEKYLQLKEARRLAGKPVGCGLVLVGREVPEDALSLLRFTELIGRDKLSLARVRGFFSQVGIDYDEMAAEDGSDITEILRKENISYINHDEKYPVKTRRYAEREFTSRFRGSRRSTWVVESKLKGPDDIIVWLSPARSGADSRTYDAASRKGKKIKTFLFNSRIPGRDIVGRRIAYKELSSLEASANIESYIKEMRMEDNTIRILRFAAKGKLEVNTISYMQGLESFGGLGGEDRQRFEDNKGKGLYFITGDPHGTTVNITSMLQTLWEQDNKRVIILGDWVDRGPAWVYASVWEQNETVESGKSLVGNHDLWLMLAAMGRVDYIAHALLHAFRYGDSSVDTMERELGIDPLLVTKFREMSRDAYGGKGYVARERKLGNIRQRGPKTEAELASMMIYLLSLADIDKDQFEQFFDYGQGDTPFKYLQPLLKEQFRDATSTDDLRSFIKRAGGEPLDILEDNWSDLVRKISEQIMEEGKGNDIVRRVLEGDLFAKIEGSWGYPKILCMHTIPWSMDKDGKITAKFKDLQARQKKWEELRQLHLEKPDFSEDDREKREKYDKLIDWVHHELAMGLHAATYLKQKDFPGFSFGDKQEEDNWAYQFLGVRARQKKGETVSAKPVGEKARRNLRGKFRVTKNDYVRDGEEYYLRESGSRKIADKMAEDCGVDIFVGGHVGKVGTFAGRLILQDPVYARKGGVGGFEDHGSALVVLDDGSLYQLDHRNFFDLITDPLTKDRVNEAVGHHIRLTEMDYYKWPLNWRQMSIYPLLMEQVLGLFGQKLPYGQEKIVFGEEEFKDMVMNGEYLRQEVNEDIREAILGELMEKGEAVVEDLRGEEAKGQKTITFIDIFRKQAEHEALNWDDLTRKFAPIRVCTPAKISKLDLNIPDAGDLETFIREGDGLLSEDAPSDRGAKVWPDETDLPYHKKIGLEEGIDFEGVEVVETDIGAGDTHEDLIRFDAQEALFLSFDLIHADLSSGRTWEVRYDTSRLSPLERKVIRTHIKMLSQKYPDSNFRLRPFSSLRNAKPDAMPLISVKCSGGGFEGVGNIDVRIPPDEKIEDYALRVVSMVNIALAVSTLPSGMPMEELKKNFGHVIAFVEKNCRSILADHYNNDWLSDIRRIVLDLPPMYRLPQKIHEYNTMMLEILVSA